MGLGGQIVCNSHVERCLAKGERIGGSQNGGQLAALPGQATGWQCSMMIWGSQYCCQNCCAESERAAGGQRAGRLAALCARSGARYNTFIRFHPSVDCCFPQKVNEKLAGNVVANWQRFVDGLYDVTVIQRDIEVGHSRQ